MAHPSADNNKTLQPTLWLQQQQQQQKSIHPTPPMFSYESSQWPLHHPPQVVMLQEDYYYCTRTNVRAGHEPTSVLDNLSSPSLESSPISFGDPNNLMIQQQQQQQVSPKGILLHYDQHWVEEEEANFKLEAADEELLFPSSSSCCSSKGGVLNGGTEWIDSFMKELECDAQDNNEHNNIEGCLRRNQPYPWTENAEERFLASCDIPSVSSSSPPPPQLLLLQASPISCYGFSTISSRFKLSSQDSARLRLERGAASVEFVELFLEIMHRTTTTEDPKGVVVDPLVKRLEAMCSQVGDPVQRVGFYFAQALINNSPCNSLRGRRIQEQEQEQEQENAIAHRALNDACPYVKFAHLSANQAILEATAGARRVHVIDYGTGMHGVQWAALLQAYAAVSSDSSPPPRLRITTVAPSSRSVELLDPIGRQLGEFAKLLQIEFEFCVVGIEELSAGKQGMCSSEEEVVAVNFMMQLRNLLKEAPERVNHRTLFEEEEDAGYGGRGNQGNMLLQNILRSVQRLRPQVLTVAEYDIGFKRSVGYSAGLVDTFLLYCAVFESLDSSPYRESDGAKRLHLARLERAMFGREIDGITADAGVDCKRALLEAGFRAVPPSNYAVSQARLLLWLYCEGFKLADDHQKECLTLGWKDRPVITVSTWQCS